MLQHFKTTESAAEFRGPYVFGLWGLWRSESGLRFGAQDP